MKTNPWFIGSIALAALTAPATAQLGPCVWRPTTPSSLFDARVQPFASMGSCIWTVAPQRLLGDAPGTFTTAVSLCRLSTAYGGSGRRYGVVIGSYDPAAGTFVPTHEADSLNGGSTVQSAALMLEPQLGRYAVFDRFDGVGNLLGPYFASRAAAGQPFGAPVAIANVPGLGTPGLAGTDPALGRVGGTLMLFFNYWQNGAQHIAMAPLDVSNPQAPTVAGSATIVVDAAGYERVHSSYPITGPDGDVEGLWHAGRMRAAVSEMCLSADLDPTTPPEAVVMSDGTFMNNGGLAGGRFVAVNDPGGYLRAVDAQGAWLVGDVESPGGTIDLRAGADVQPGASTASVFVWLGLPTVRPTRIPGVFGVLDLLPVLDIGVIATDASGLGDLTFPAPADPGLAGAGFPIQGVSLDRNAATVTLTNRATIRL